MPKYSNSFASPAYIEETILSENGKVKGTIRIKPSGVLWKEGKGKYYTVSLDDFIAWVKNPTTNAGRTSS